MRTLKSVEVVMWCGDYYRFQKLKSPLKRQKTNKLIFWEATLLLIGQSSKMWFQVSLTCPPKGLFKLAPLGFISLFFNFCFPHWYLQVNCSRSAFLFLFALSFYFIVFLNSCLYCIFLFSNAIEQKQFKKKIKFFLITFFVMCLLRKFICTWLKSILIPE